MKRDELIDNNIAVLQAIKEGKTVQWRFAGGSWTDYGFCKEPRGGLDFRNYEWRVKPEEKFMFAIHRKNGSTARAELLTQAAAEALLTAYNTKGVECSKPYTMKKYKEVVE